MVERWGGSKGKRMYIDLEGVTAVGGESAGVSVGEQAVWEEGEEHKFGEGEEFVPGEREVGAPDGVSGEKWSAAELSIVPQVHCDVLVCSNIAKRVYGWSTLLHLSKNTRSTSCGSHRIVERK